MELVRQRGSHRQYRHPTRPGLATGRIIDETVANMRDALAFHFDGLRADGLSVPPPSTRAAVIDLA